VWWDKHSRAPSSYEVVAGEQPDRAAGAGGTEEEEEGRPMLASTVDIAKGAASAAGEAGVASAEAPEGEEESASAGGSSGRIKAGFGVYARTTNDIKCRFETILNMAANGRLPLHLHDHEETLQGAAGRYAARIRGETRRSHLTKRDDADAEEVNERG